MADAEYPKRLYLDGLAVTVNNEEEEERWLNPPLLPEPVEPEPDTEALDEDPAPKSTHAPKRRKP